MLWYTDFSSYSTPRMLYIIITEENHVENIDIPLQVHPSKNLYLLIGTMNNGVKSFKIYVRLPH